MFVLDASVTLSWAFEDEATPEVEIVFERLRTGGAVVPALWPLEIANGLLVAGRRGRLSADLANQFLQQLRRLRIRIDASPTLETVPALMGLAAQHGLSIYDASYLELAGREGVPLASSDERLRAAASAAGVPLLN